VTDELILMLLFADKEKIWEDWYELVLAADHGRGDRGRRAQRRIRAVQLRREEFTDAAIAKDVGVSLPTLRDDLEFVRRAIRDDNLAAAA
jgi:hypothetical protein